MQGSSLSITSVMSAKDAYDNRDISALVMVKGSRLRTHFSGIGIKYFAGWHS